MICLAGNGEKGFCECINGFVWDGSACITSGTTPSVRIIGGEFDIFLTVYNGFLN